MCDSIVTDKRRDTFNTVDTSYHHGDNSWDIFSRHILNSKAVAHISDGRHLMDNIRKWNLREM